MAALRGPEPHCCSPAHEDMTNTSKSRKRCPACGSSNPADAWECEMCGTSFADVKPPKSVQQADANQKAGTPTPVAQPKPASKPAPTQSTKIQAKPATSQSASTKPATSKPATKATAATLASSNTSKAATETINTPIKNAGSMKKPAPLYASKPRFGLGSLAALVFVAAFAIAAIVFGLNALSTNTPATAPAQPAAFTLDVTPTILAMSTDITPAQAGAATQAPTLEPTVAPTEAPIEVPAVGATEALTEAPAATATTEPTIAPSPTSAGKPSATPHATKTPAPTPTQATTTTPAATAALGTGETVTYTVKGGDTCGAVAKRLNVTVAQIIQQNNLDERCFLRVNQVLTIKK